MVKKEVVYTAESDIKSPRKLFRSMYVDLLASRELAYTLMKRDIQGQYRQSILGFIWAFIPPIITATTFTLASSFKVLNIGTTNIPYPAYIVFSTALWQTFVESVNAPMGAVGGSLSLFTRIKMPKEAPILAKMGDIYFNFAVKLVLITAVFLIYRLPVSPLAVLAPLALVCMITFGFSIGLLLAPIASLFGDIGRAVSAVLGIGMFLTPVVYPAPKGHGLFAAIVKANPVTHLLIGIRELTLFGRIPNFQFFIIISLVGFVLLFIAWVLYRLAIPYVVERKS